MESEFESYDNQPNGWVHLFQVGYTARLSCGAQRSESHLYQFFHPARGPLELEEGGRAALLLYNCVRSHALRQSAVPP